MKIYNSSGTQILDVQVDDNSFRHRVIMGDNNLTLHYSLAVHVEIPVGSYCVFEGQTFTLKRPENLKMKHTRNFEYTVLLESPQADAKIWKFRNTVDGRLKFPLTARASEHLAMFVANMNRRGSGWSVGSCIDSVEHLINYDHDYCWDALAKMADEFGTEFEIVGKQVSLKRVEYNKSNPLALSYGKGNGFRSGIARNSSDTMPVEILFVQGGTQNIDSSKYHSSVLLLPKNQSISYDGEHFEGEAGYSSSNARSYVVDNLGLSIRRSDKSPSTYAEDSLDCSSVYPRRVGKVSSVVTEDAEQNFYDIVDNSIPSSLNYADCQIEGEKLTVIFQSGMLAGHGEFDVNYFHNAVNGKAARRFEIVPKDEDGYTMPNETFKPAVNDEYVIFNCMLPDAYICDNNTKTGAEWDMFKEAVRYMFNHEEEIFSFKGELDSIWAKQDWVNIGGKIVLGGYISFTDSRFQPSGILVRIVGIKDYVNNPHKPEIELSNQTQSVGLGTDIKKLESYEVETEEYHRDALSFTKRRFRDAKETMDMLQALIDAGFDNFTNGITPITVQTMQLLVGDESLQYRFVNNTTTPSTVAHNVTYNASTKVLSAPEGTIQHLTLGIKNLSSSHAATEYKYWSVSAYNSAALTDGTKKYYLYIKASKSASTATFTLSETPIAMEAVSGYYHFLYGILNSEYEDGRSFVPLYGFSEVLPGRVTTDKVVSGDGNSFFDMLNNAMKLGDMLKFNINGDGKLVLKGTIVQSQGGEDEEVLGCFRGVWNASYVYYVGDEVVYTANNITSYYRCIQQTTAGIAPTNTAYWQVLSAGLRGHFKARAFKRTNTDISSTTPSGGSYDSPTPTGWEDGVPDGTAQLWSTVCTFYSDGTSSGWSHPARETDTDTLDIEFSPSSTAPSAPTGNTPFADHSSEGWYDPNNLPSGQTMIWRAERKVSNGVYDGGWVITRIYGERGMDGDGFEYIFKTRTSIWNNPTAPATSQTDDYVPTGWTDDPSGVDSTNQYEYVSMRKKHLGVWGNFSTPSLWAKWSNDGDNGNYIILRYRWAVDKPAQPSGSDPYPANWYDNADREDPTMQYAGSWYGRNGFYYSPKISHEEVTWQKVKFTTTKPCQVVAVDLHVSSETNYDFARVGQLDNAGIINLHPVNDKAALDAQTIAKISGSTSTIVYVEVATEGEHFFYVGYTKDTSSDVGSDQAWFRILKTENMRCWLCQALVDGETGYVDTWGEVIQFIYDNSSEESIYLLSESSTAPSTPTSEPLIEDYVPYLTSEFYSETKSYAVGNKVMHSPYTGYVYAFECIAACTGVAPTNTSYWKQIQTWTDDPQSVTSTYRYQFVSIRRKTNGRWGSFSTPQLYTSYIKGDKGDTGDYFEYRYAVNGSTTTAPALSTTVRNPSGWSTVVPSVGSLQYLWMSVAKINGQTEELLQNWSTPKRVTPVDGTKGDSPALVYRGVYSASASYVGTAYRVDAVKYGDAWYVARTDAGSSFSNVLPTDTSKWNPFGSSFESIATGLLLAENANIAGWIFRNGRLESQKQSNGSPMAFLNGETGEMRLHGTLQLSTAYSGNISDSNLIYLPAKAAGSSASYLSMGQEKDDIGKVVRLFNSSAFGGGRYYIEANTFEVEDNGDSTWSMSGTDYTAIVDPQEIIEMTCFERSGSVTGRKKGQWVLTGRFGVDNFKQDAAKGRFPRMIAMGKITGSSSSPSISGTMYNGKSLSTAGFTISRLGEGHYKVSFSSGTLPSGYYVFFTGYGDNWKGSLVNDTSTSFEVKIADDSSLNDGSMQFIILDSNNWWYSM